jgi:alpha-amylase/alpha-mannosidase (GH57 family)
MTHDINDFETKPILDNWGQVQTASTTLALTGFGRIQWKVYTDKGVPFILQVPGFLVPGSNVRLLSPQDYVRHHQLPSTIDQFGGNSSSFWMSLQNGEHIIRANIDPQGNLPIMLGTQVSNPSWHCHVAISKNSTDNNVLSADNGNLSNAQQRLLLDHQRLGHQSFKRLQRLYRSSSTDRDFMGCSQKGETCLPHRPPSSSTCTPPLCVACQIAKAKRRPAPGKLTKNYPRFTGP